MDISGSSPEIDWQARLQEAGQLLDKGALAEAEIAYHAIATTSPKNVQAHLGQGKCARRKGEHQAALAHFETAVSLDPSDPWARLEVATALRAVGQLDNAENAYHEVIALARDNVQAWLGLGQCARERGDVRTSLAHFQAGILAAPADPWPLVELAITYRQLCQTAAAEAGFQQALAIMPENIQALLGLGHCARARGDIRTALSHFEAASIIAPADPWPRLEVAECQRELGLFDAAKAGFATVLTMMPENVQAHLGLGHCANACGDNRAALTHFEAADRTAPDNPWPRLYVAAAQRELGEVDAAMDGFQHVLTMDPGNVQAHLGLGHCAKARGELTAALTHFDAAKAAEMTNPWPRLEMAATQRDLGQLDSAEASFREVLELSPGNVHAYLGLGHCARLRGDRALALAHFKAAAEAKPDIPSPWLEIATEQRDQGEIDLAAQTARAVLAKHPGDMHALLSIAFTERAATRHEAALEAFQHAHAAYPLNADILVEMALEARTLGHQEHCDSLLAQALNLNPKNIQALLRQAEQALMAADIERALTLYRGAAAVQPGEVEFHIGVAEALAAMGQPEDALSNLAALQAARGPLPRIITTRLRLLRRSGLYHEALSLAREAVLTAPHHFYLWLEQFESEMLVGSDSNIAACLAHSPANSRAERGLLRRCMGNFAESQWQLADALVHYEAAAALLPEDGGLSHDLARVSLLRLDTVAAQAHLRHFRARTAVVTRLQKKSQNISQTHLGQIIDDYTLDAPLLHELAALSQQPPQISEAGYTAAVLANPDSTAAAVSLMLAWRLSGTFTRAVGLAGAAIPRAIVQFWDSETPPEDISVLRESWHAHNPGYSRELFNDATAQAFLASTYPPAVLLAYRRVFEPAQKADIFRLAYLAARGGVYVDADDRCLAPLESILPADAALVCYQEDHGTLGNNFIAAVPGHPVLQLAMALAVDAINRGDTDNVWLATGPALLTRAAAQILAENFDPEAKGLLPGVFVLHRRDLFRAVAIHCSAGYKVTQRHWGNSSFSRGRQKKWVEN
jgi:tetratricopeptide (TPR) repeat protein